jgi:hypothetical protein
VLFVTRSKILAENYIEKYNNLLTKMLDWFYEIQRKAADVDYQKDSSALRLIDKYWTVDEQHPAQLITIEIR